MEWFGPEVSIFGILIAASAMISLIIIAWLLTLPYKRRYSAPEYNQQTYAALLHLIKPTD